MTDALNLWDIPQAREIVMIVGWRQWADAGSISSGLPRYLAQQSGARKIGALKPDGFYLFQIPGTHDLVRPVVKFVDGYPTQLETPRNEFFYTGDAERGVVIFLGDEPHLDIERYVQTLLTAAERLKVTRIVGLGGVYGELPYDKERLVSSNYSLPALKADLDELAVTYSDYHGGASIGSYLCKRAGEREMAYLSFYGFVPTYDFSNISQIGNTIRLENDYMAWLGIMRRVNVLLKTRFDLSDLESKTAQLLDVVDAKVAELEAMAPELGVRAYFETLSEEFDEVAFNPLADVWEEELRRLLDDDQPPA
ncbi:MAG: PAC2 family protein [Anaerolineae bacterium]|nr:PAC2 family protein [Anaerolineae bacterium]